MDCLDNVIGLSETTCNCFDDGKPINYNESRSGIFLDQLEGLELEMNKAADDCGRGGMWDRMARAVRNSTLQFQADLLSCVQMQYKQRKDNWSGLLGGSSFTGALNPGTTYAGIKISPWNIKGGYIYIKRIGVLVNQSVPVTVKIFSNENGGTLIASYTINATANVLTYAGVSPTPLELPLWSYNTTQIKYYALFDLTPANFLPLNNKKDCGCGGVQRPYLNWLDFIGTKGNNVSDFNTFSDASSNEVNGILLDIDVKCKLSQIICTEEEPLDFVNDGRAKQLAYAIRFKAGELLLNDLYTSPNINRFTLMDREKMQSYAKYYRSEYNKWIDFLCQNAELDNNDCFICKNTSGLIMANIKV